MRRKPPLPQESWDRIPPDVQEALWEVMRGYERRITVLQRVLQRISFALQEANIPAGTPLRALPPDTLKDLHPLSPREWEVLQLLLTNYRPPAIASALHISPHTVRSHLKAIFRKLGVHSQSALLERLRR